MEKSRPILVVGTGRSGTSAVTKALIDLGVDMGFVFKNPDKNNPEGVYEDLFFRLLNNFLLEGKITEITWEAGVVLLAETRDDLWGFKDPNTAQLLPEYKAVFHNPKFVWARRNIDEAIDSCVRCYNMDRNEASVLMHHRNNMCEKHLKGQDVLEVWCGKLNVKKLKEFINA